MSPDPMHDSPDPAEALAAIQRARTDVHRKVAEGSWRYDLTYSAITAGMIGSQALNMPLSTLGIALGVIALALLLRSESERTGLTITGLTPKGARWVAFSLGGVFLVLMISVLILARKAPSQDVLVFGTVAVMALAFGAALAGSRMWRRVYRREMGVEE